MASKLAHTSFLSSSISGTRCRPLKKQISLFCFFFFLFDFALQLFFSKKARRLYFIMIIIQEIYSQELWSFTSWCCNLFSLSKTVHRPVYLSIWCKNHSAAYLPACHALGCPVCQAAKATCTAGAQWEKFVIFRFAKQILTLTLLADLITCHYLTTLCQLILTTLGPC